MDDSVIIGTRDIKMALRRLRKFARQGNDLELDMDDTIKSTAKNAGYLDIKMVPERLNSVKVIVLFFLIRIFDILSLELYCIMFVSQNLNSSRKITKMP